MCYMAVVPLFNLAADLTVSRLCLGTMTFGEQNTLPQSLQLLDKAFGSGINFFDSAEMYPVPQRAQTQGRSEEYFGRWMRDRKIPRDRVVVATKVSGPSGQMSWIRNGPESLDAWNITEAINNSLLRLQTDYIDLYQIHWPDRYVPMFGETRYDPDLYIPYVSFNEQLDALGRAVEAGKIRYVGLSNETPYGVMKFLEVAQNEPHYPRIVSVQNSYNLLCQIFDLGMTECCHHERVSLLAYSPLAMGILSGKYLSHDKGPADARFNLFRGRYTEGESRYNLSRTNLQKATKSYLEIAAKYDIHPVSFAIAAFVMRHPLVASTIFGATKLWQLQEVLDACTVNLSSEMIADIDKVHSRDQVHSMDSPHDGATSQELELETFQKQVAERFNELLGADSSELLSIPWIRLMVQLLGVFATMPFIFTALADGSRLFKSAHWITVSGNSRSMAIRDHLGN